MCKHWVSPNACLRDVAGISSIPSNIGEIFFSSIRRSVYIYIYIFIHIYIYLYTPHEQCVVFALLFLLHKTIYQDCSVNGVLPHTKQWMLTTAETSLSLLRCLAYQTSPNFTRSPQKPASVITHPTNHILFTAFGTFRAPKSIHLHVHLSHSLHLLNHWPAMLQRSQV